MTTDPPALDEAALEAVARAQEYAADTFDVRTSRVVHVARGASWFVIALRSPQVDLLDMPSLVVRDSGEVHAEPVPVGPWFTGLTTVAD